MVIFFHEVRKEIFLWRTLSDMKGRKTEKRKSKQNVNSMHLNFEIRLVACSEVTQQNNYKHRTLSLVLSLILIYFASVIFKRKNRITNLYHLIRRCEQQ